MSNQAMKRLIEEIESLPIEERIRVADSVLKTLNPTDQEIESKWVIEAESRLRELKEGMVQSVSEDQLFEKVGKRYSE